MSTLRLAGLLASALAIASSSCAPCKNKVQEQIAAPSWPQELAGRKLQVIADPYALYANDAEVAKGLAAWVDVEVAAFRSRYGRGPTGAGIILAIEPGEEPSPALRDLYGAKRGSGDPAPTASRSVPALLPSLSERPYCVSRWPYFRESSPINYQEAVRTGLLEKEAPRPDWICCLTTNEHLRAQFEKALSARARSQRKRVAKVPLLVRVLSFPAMMIYRPVGMLITWKYRAIDGKLMRLDRREVLLKALIDSRFVESRDRLSAVEELRGKTDQRWQYLYRHRPID